MRSMQIKKRESQKAISKQMDLKVDRVNTVELFTQLLIEKIQKYKNKQSEQNKSKLK